MNCSNGVSGFQKYCTECEKQYKQDALFWKTNWLKSLYDSKELEQEIQEHLDKDRI